MLRQTDSDNGRLYQDANGQEYVGVTSSIRLIGSLLGEPDEFAAVPAPLLRMHALEGEACHAAALDWLAVRAGWLDKQELPPWPEREHPDKARWFAVLHHAVAGFRLWVERTGYEPEAIEQASFNKAYGLAGRPDTAGSLLVRAQRLRSVIDLKFVAALQRSHEIQVRLYGILEHYKDVQIGMLLRIDRTTGQVEERPVYLKERPEDTAAAIAASQLERWRLKNR